MIQNGMNVARLNFSHGSYENHLKLMKNIREISKKLNKPIAILQDYRCPFKEAACLLLNLRFNLLRVAFSDRF